MLSFIDYQLFSIILTNQFDNSLIEPIIIIKSTLMNLQQYSLDMIKHGSSIDVLENVPTFLSKTYQILQNNDYNQIVSWTKNGQGFIVKKVKQFAEKILPLHFRHSNYSSFVRQLNMYDFHKMRQDNQENAFKNTLFKKGQKHLLKQIQRKDYKKNKDVRLQLNFKHDDSHRKRRHITNPQNVMSKELDIEVQSGKLFELSHQSSSKYLLEILNMQQNMLDSLESELDKDEEMNTDGMIDMISKLKSLNNKFEFPSSTISERLCNFYFTKLMKWGSLTTDQKPKQKSKAVEFPSWANIISSTTFCGSSKIISDFRDSVFE